MIRRTSMLKRGAWRWVVASAVLLAACASTWWYWPRGDARFVGRWLYSPYDDKLPEMELVLNRNGTGCLQDATRPGNRWVLNWSSGDGALELSRQLASENHFIKFLSKSVFGMTGLHQIDKPLVYEVTDVTTHRLQMRRVRIGHSSSPTLLTRIAE